MKFTAAIAAIFSFSCVSANAYNNGNELYEAMQNQSHDLETILFVQGVLEGSVWGFEIGTTGTVLKIPLSAAQRGLGICTTTMVTKGQVNDVVLAYLKNNPEKRHFAASFLVLIAMRSAFPCN